MPRSFTLVNVSDGVHDTDVVIDAGLCGQQRPDAEWSVRLQRLQGGLSDGVDVVWLDNGCTRLAILPPLLLPDF